MSPAPPAPLLDALRAGGIARNVPAAEVPARLADAARRLPGADPGVTDLLAQLVTAPGALHWALVGDGLAVGAGVRALAALIHVHVGAAVHEQRRVDEVVGDDDIGAGQTVAPGEGQQLRIPGTRTHDRDEAAHGRRV